MLRMFRMLRMPQPRAPDITRNSWNFPHFMVGLFLQLIFDEFFSIDFRRFSSFFQLILNILDIFDKLIFFFSCFC